MAPALTYQDLRSDSLDYQGISPTLYAGYGDWVRDWLWLAGEIFGSTKSINLGNDKSENGLSLKMNYTYGVSLIPAINMDNTLTLFMRLGYERAKFSALDTTEGAYQVGLGLQTNLIDCWDIRAEYDYTPFHSVPQVGSIRGNSFTLAAVYRFVSMYS